MIFGGLDQGLPAMDAPTVTLRPSDSRCWWHDGRMPLAAGAVKKISLIQLASIVVEQSPVLWTLSPLIIEGCPLWERNYTTRLLASI